MNTLKEIIQQNDKFAKVTVYNLSTNILDRFIKENNGTIKEFREYIMQWCIYKDNLITFTYPNSPCNINIIGLNKYNELKFQLNTLPAPLRLIDIATSFGNYFEDLDQQYEKFLEILNVKIQVAGFSPGD